MPKQKEKELVLYDWIANLTFQQQALLMTGMRGPDGCSKHNSAKALVRYLRGVCLKPAGEWNGENNNDFMWGDYAGDAFVSWARDFYLEHDEYPHHFIMHLIHCAEVVAYKHPTHEIRLEWLTFYANMCKAMHMMIETEEQMDARLNDFK